MLFQVKQNKQTNQSKKEINESKTKRYTKKGIMILLLVSLFSLFSSLKDVQEKGEMKKQEDLCYILEEYHGKDSETQQFFEEQTGMKKDFGEYCGIEETLESAGLNLKFSATNIPIAPNAYPQQGGIKEIFRIEKGTEDEKTILAGKGVFGGSQTGGIWDWVEELKRISINGTVYEMEKLELIGDSIKDHEHHGEIKYDSRLGYEDYEEYWINLANPHWGHKNFNIEFGFWEIKNFNVEDTEFEGVRMFENEEANDMIEKDFIRVTVDRIDILFNVPSNGLWVHNTRPVLYEESRIDNIYNWMINNTIKESWREIDSYSFQNALGGTEYKSLKRSPNLNDLAIESNYIRNIKSLGDLGFEGYTPEISGDRMEPVSNIFIIKK